MPRITLAFFASLVLLTALVGCETVDSYTLKRYPRNNEYGRAWLSDQVMPPTINVTGKWRSSEWGRVYLGQTDRSVNGYMGDYVVEGVVSGNKAYLLLTSNNWYYYSLILEMPREDMLIGYYSKSIPYKSSNRSNVRLDRSIGP